MGIVTPFPHARIVAGNGPVSRAIRAMRAMSPQELRDLIPEMRRRIEDEIEANLALLDLLDGNADDEPSLCGLGVDEPAVGAYDAEGPDDNGIADDGGEAEQRGIVWFGSAEELSPIDGRPLVWIDGMLVSEAHA